MEFGKHHHHTIDILFVFILFGLFTFSAVILIIIGADIYTKTVHNMDYNFNDRTSISYITEKIRSSDQNGSVFFDSFNNIPALAMTETIEDTTYVTYLYFYEDAIYELFTRKDLTLMPSDGKRIIPAQSFQINEINEHLYLFSLIDTKQKEVTFYVSTHSTPEKTVEVREE